MAALLNVIFSGSSSDFNIFPLLQLRHEELNITAKGFCKIDYTVIGYVREMNLFLFSENKLSSFFLKIN